MTGSRRSLAGALVLMLCLAGCRSSGGSGAAGRRTVHVLYAGSLVNLMEKQIGPRYSRATGDGYQGYGSDSQSVANAIKGHVKRGDVFICADPAVDATLIGSGNGDWVRWYARFATAPLVLGYSSKSRFAAALRTTPWYDVLQQPGIRVGVTDPTLDPKGKLTVAALHTAQQVYRLRPDFAASTLKHTAVFPEQDLLGRVESGQLDVGFFYPTEAIPAQLPTVSLGRVHEAATFTVTVLDHARDPAAGSAFVHYLLTTGRSALAAGGLHLQHPVVSGSAAAVPASLRSLLQ